MPDSSRLFRLVATSLCLSGFVSLARAEDATPTYAMADPLHLPGSTRWDYLTFDAPHRRLFITRGDSVDVLDVGSKKIVGAIAHLDGVYGVALAPDLNKGFITEGKANRVSIFDMTSLKVLATTRTGEKPDAVAYDAATRRIFAADGESGDLTVIDASSGAAIGAIKLDGQPEFVVVDRRGRLYVNLEDKSQIAVVDTKTMKLLARYDLAPACERPTGLAMDTAHDRLFPVCGGKTMLVVDAETGKVLAALPIGAHTDAAAFDAATGLAFASNGDGTLTIVGAAGDGRYKVLQTIRTWPSARTMALDPTTHTIYLAAAQTEGFDAPTDGRPQPRPHMAADSFAILTVSPSP